MPEITFEQAKEFLEKINKEDTVAIIHHDDLDGFASGLLLYEFCKKKGAKVNNYPYTISKTKIENIPEETIMITDLAPNTITNLFDLIKEKPVLYIDHHKKQIQIPLEILELRNSEASSATKMIFEILKEDIAKEKIELSEIYARTADAGDTYEENQNFIEKISEKYNLSKENFLKKIREIDSILIYFSNNLKKGFEEFSKIKTFQDIFKLERFSKPIEEEIDFFKKDYKENKEMIGKVNFYLFSPKFPIKSAVTTSISFKQPEEIFVFGTIQKNQIRISARNQTKKMNMIDLLQAGIKNIDNASAGGHIPAAGANFQTKDLEKFKENLKNYLENMPTPAS